MPLVHLDYAPPSSAFPRIFCRLRQEFDNRVRRMARRK
jgi:hypothetical protein